MMRILTILKAIAVRMMTETRGTSINLSLALPLSTLGIKRLAEIVCLTQTLDEISQQHALC